MRPIYINVVLFRKISYQINKINYIVRIEIITKMFIGVLLGWENPEIKITFLINV